MITSTKQRKSKGSRIGGPRSRGCITCKSRKIKCDEIKPECTHCIKTGRRCGGYQDHDSFIFRHETPRLKRKYGDSVPDHAALQSSDDSSPLATVITSELPNTRRPHPYEYPRNSIEQECLNFFLGKYIVNLPKCSGPIGFLGLLPRLFSMAREGTCLQKALLATALTVAGKERLDPRLAVASRTHYQATLKATNECLSDPTRATSDEVLGTIELLRFRESFSYVFADPEVSTMAKHIKGGLTLLRMRGPAMAQTQDGAVLFIAFSVHGLAESLMSRRDLYPFLKGFARLISSSRPPLLSHSAMLHVPSILQRFDKIKSVNKDIDSSEAQAELLAIILHSADVDSKIHSGLEALPEGWKPRAIVLPPSFELPHPPPGSRFLPGLFQSKFKYYEHAAACTGYLFLIIGRLYLQRLQLDAFALLRASTKQSMAFDPTVDCVNTINSCVEDFTESMAFLEGYHIFQRDPGLQQTEQLQLKCGNSYGGEPDIASVGGWCVPWMVSEITNQTGGYLDAALALRVSEWVKYCQNLMDRTAAFWDVVGGI